MNSETKSNDTEYNLDIASLNEAIDQMKTNSQGSCIKDEIEQDLQVAKEFNELDTLQHRVKHEVLIEQPRFEEIEEIKKVEEIEEIDTPIDNSYQLDLETEVAEPLVDNISGSDNNIERQPRSALQIIDDGLKEFETMRSQMNNQDSQADAKQEEIETKLAEIDTKLADLDTKRAEVDAKQAVFDKKQAEFDNRRKEVEAKEIELDAKLTEIQNQQVELDRKRQEVIEQESNLSTKLAELDSQRKELERKDYEIQDKVNSNEEQHRDLSFRLDEIENHEAELFVAQQDVLMHRREIEQRAADLDKRVLDFENLRTETESLKLELDEQQFYLDDRETEIEKRENEIAEKLQTVELQGQELDLKVTEIEKRIDEIAQKESELYKRSAKLDGHATEIYKRKSELDDKEVSFKKREKELQLRASSLDERAIDIEERLRIIDQQQQDLKRKASELEINSNNVEQSHRRLDERAKELEKRANAVEQSRKDVEALVRRLITREKEVLESSKLTNRQLEEHGAATIEDSTYNDTIKSRASLLTQQEELLEQLGVDLAKERQKILANAAEIAQNSPAKASTSNVNELALLSKQLPASLLPAVWQPPAQLKRRMRATFAFVAGVAFALAFALSWYWWSQGRPQFFEAFLKKASSNNAAIAAKKDTNKVNRADHGNQKRKEISGSAALANKDENEELSDDSLDAIAADESFDHLDLPLEYPVATEVSQRAASRRSVFKPRTYARRQGARRNMTAAANSTKSKADDSSSNTNDANNVSTQSTRLGDLFDNDSDVVHLGPAAKPVNDITAILKKRGREFKPCFLEAKRRGDITAGDYSIEFVAMVLPDGAVSNIRLGGAAIARSPNLKKCITDVAVKWRLPSSGKTLIIKTMAIGPITVR
ncbi:MAG: hypothetical protein JW841_13600 [Deltaproteobacteria bacterium]|nr:hypothetical protein [Deltaproteobacteria bacterium]